MSGGSTGHNFTGTWAARGLPPMVQATLVAHGQARSAEPGETIYRVGDLADTFFVVESGELDVLTVTNRGEETWMATVGPGGWVGMAAAAGLIVNRTDLRYTETLRATESTTLRACTVPELRELAKTGTFGSALQLLVIRRLDRLAGQFAALFGELPFAVLLDAQQAFRHVAVLAGETLFREGDETDGVYVVESGRLDVMVGPPGAERRVAELGPGQLLGELAFFSGAPRSATIQARRDTFLLHAPNAGFQDVLDRHPRVALALAGILARRNNPTAGLQRREASGRVILLVTPPGPRAERFVGELANAMSPSAVVLSQRDFHKEVGELTGRLSMLRRRFRTWLDQAEEEHPHILLRVGEEWDWWTQLCLRQSDQLARVVEAGSRPEPIRVERERAVDDLILLHPRGTRRTTQTGQWLDDRPELLRHLNVADGEASDVGRVARFLSRRAVGVAFGGGAARCFVHVGVIIALAELGIPIDAVSGTSSGSHVAAAVAAGMTPDEVYARLRRGMVEQNPMGRATLPIVALRDTRSTLRIAQEVCEGRAIEDLWLPFRCVSTDLTAMEARIHSRGDLARALLASGSPPVLMPPVIENGHVLCDGGLLDNLPVAPLRRLGATRLLASRVSRTTGVAADESLVEIPSGLSVLLRKLSPFHQAPRLPNILTMAFNSVTCASVLQGKEPEARPDVLLSPPVDAFGATEFARHEEMVEAGRRYTLEQARTLRDALTGSLGGG